jgi:hypothetical protein
MLPFVMDLQRLQSGPDAFWTALDQSERVTRLALSGDGLIVMACDGMTPAAFVPLPKARLNQFIATKAMVARGAPFRVELVAGAALEEVDPFRAFRRYAEHAVGFIE